MITIQDLPRLVNDSDSRCDWERRRPKIKSVLEENEYGAIPPALAPTVKVEQKKLFFAGKGYRKTSRFRSKKTEKIGPSLQNSFIPPKRRNVRFSFLLILRRRSRTDCSLQKKLSTKDAELFRFVTKTFPPTINLLATAQKNCL